MKKQSLGQLSKLKNFFKSGRNVHSGQADEFEITVSVLAEIGPDVASGQRLKNIRNLTSLIKDCRLEYGILEDIWRQISDLLGSDEISHRHSCFDLITTAMASPEACYMSGLVKRYFFHLFEDHMDKPFAHLDTVYMVKIVILLSDNGKDSRLGPLLGATIYRLFPMIIGSTSPAAVVLHQPADGVESVPSQLPNYGCPVPIFFGLFYNLIENESVDLSNESVHYYINSLCQFCLDSNSSKEYIILSLENINGLVCKRGLPKQCLNVLCSMLCQVVGVPEYANHARGVMVNIMSARLAHAAVLFMLHVMQDAGFSEKYLLIRGAVRFVGVCLWGSKPNRYRSRSELYTPIVVLPFFERALKGNNWMITSEVVTQMDLLIKNAADDLDAAVCDAIMHLYSVLKAFIVSITDPNISNPIWEKLHCGLTLLEVSNSEHKYAGREEKLYDMIELFYEGRSESSLKRLIDHKAKNIDLCCPGWLTSFVNLMKSFYCVGSQSSNIRLKMLEVSRGILLAPKFYLSYEEDLLDHIILPFFSNLLSESCQDVICETIQVLIDVITKYFSRRLCTVLEILARILERPMAPSSFITLPTSVTGILSGSDRPAYLDIPPSSLPSQETIQNLLSVVRGLISIFRAKLCSVECVTLVTAVYEVLLQHLGAHYRNNELYFGAWEVRLEIFRLLLDLRVDSRYKRLGILQENGGDNLSHGAISYCRHIVCREELDDQIYSEKTSDIVPQTRNSLTYISLRRGCRQVIFCLVYERNWPVLKFVLTHVTESLKNRSLVSAFGKNISKFVISIVALAGRIHERFLSNFHHIGISDVDHCSRGDCLMKIFSITANLVSYAEFFDYPIQQLIIRSFEIGFSYDECRVFCMTSLTLCALEMKEAMYKIITVVLHIVSRVSTIKSISIQLLEFLSTLVRVPTIYSSFTDNDVKLILAMALPFTNPLRHNAYVISLAHHVVVMWYLMSRESSRPAFVPIIVKGLDQHVKQPLSNLVDGKSTNLRPPSTSAATILSSKGGMTVNEDSSDRKRASSWTQQEKPRLRMRNFTGRNSNQMGVSYLTGASTSRTNPGPPPPSVNTSFHLELREVCIDLLARSLFGNFNVRPKRLPTADMIFKNGQSLTWIIDNMLLTITTSGCKEGVQKGFFCSNCVNECQKSSIFSSESPLFKDFFISMRPNDIKKVSLKFDEDCAISSGCRCWCNGWAEIYIRRPSGNTSYMVRCQNGVIGPSTPENIVQFLSALAFCSLNSGSNYEASEKIDDVSDDVSTNQNLFQKTSDNTQCENLKKGLEQVFEPTNYDIPRKISLQARPTSTKEELIEETSTSLRHCSLDAFTAETYQSGHVRNRSATYSGTSGVDKRSILTGGVGRQENYFSAEWTTGMIPQMFFFSLYSHVFTNVAISKPEMLDGVEHKPILLPKTPAANNAILVFDSMHANETYKVGVIYIDLDQGKSNESDILRNVACGCDRYDLFLKGLGNLISLRNVNKDTTFTGCLDFDEGDGEFTYLWNDHLMQVIFHVATLMPNRDNDPAGNFKKMHIGNDCVLIVYNNSGRPTYDMKTIRTDVIIVCIIITPLDEASNMVVVDCVPELYEFLTHLMTPKIVSDRNLSSVVRQYALHCNLAAQIEISKLMKKTDPYSCNRLLRLRLLKRLKTRILDNVPTTMDAGPTNSNKDLNQLLGFVFNQNHTET